jgi:hypothetical protein
MKCVLSDAIRINELENIDANTVIHISVNFIVYLLFLSFLQQQILFVNVVLSTISHLPMYLNILMVYLYF